MSHWIAAFFPDRFSAYFSLMRFDRPIGTYLLLWPVLWSLWLAHRGVPSIDLLVIFVVGVFLMRAAGSVMNDIADRDIDPHVARTQSRPLASQRISLGAAVRCFTLLLALSGCLLLRLNAFCMAIAVLGVLMTIIYPYTKRFLACPQCFLGLTWSLGILMVFAAVQGQLSGLAWLVYAINMVLTIAYDTMYAMGDRADDLKIGVRSTAILFGRYDRIIVAGLQLLVFLLFILLGITQALSFPYYLSLVIVAGLMIYQQALIKDSEPAHCLAAFKSHHYLGMIVFMGIVLGLK